MKTVDVVVPVCNEGSGIGATLVRLADYFSIHSRYRFDFVIVDDGSTDQTYERAQMFARHRKNVTVLRHDRVYGVGRALRTAFNKASADYTLVLDTHVPEASYLAMQLLEVLDTAGSDIALASAGSRIALKWVQKTRSYVHAFTCMVRAYRTQFIKSVHFASDGAAANVELLLEAIKNDAVIVAMPMTMPKGVAGHVRSLCGIPPVLARRMWACRAQFPWPYRPQLARG